MVTTDYVMSLYRLILGREPESIDVVKQHVDSGADELSLLSNFLRSREFLDRGLNMNVAARPSYPDRLPVEVAASKEQLKAMLDGIASKWSEYGNDDPYWSVLTHENFRIENIDVSREQFYRTGHGDIAVALQALRRNGIDLRSLKSCIDFGCGVGRLSLALAKHIPTVTGIDISAGHLRLAQHQARETKVSNVNFRLIQNIDDISTVPSVDLVLSLIVLQHNPPPVMAEIFARLLRRLNTGGVAYIQMPTFIEGYAFEVKKYLNDEKQDMEMNYLPQRTIFKIIRDEGCAVLEASEDGSTGNASIVSHTFLIQKL